MFKIKCFGIHIIKQKFYIQIHLLNILNCTKYTKHFWLKRKKKSVLYPYNVFWPKKCPCNRIRHTGHKCIMSLNVHFGCFSLRCCKLNELFSISSKYFSIIKNGGCSFPFCLEFETILKLSGCDRDKYKPL